LLDENLLHALVTDGAFDLSGRFRPLSLVRKIDWSVLEGLFAKNVIKFLIKKRRLSLSFGEKMLSWEHTGFSVNGSVKIKHRDETGSKSLVRYMARPPISFERVMYDSQTGKVTVYNVKKNAFDRFFDKKAEYPKPHKKGESDSITFPQGNRLNPVNMGVSKTIAFSTKEDENLDIEGIKKSSRRCRKCGHTAKSNRLTQEEFHCQKCGHTENADYNVAKNILRLGMEAPGQGLWA